MAEMLHEYTKVVVVRQVNRVFDDGSLIAQIAVDTDEPTRQSAVGSLVHAIHFLLQGGGTLYDSPIDLANLPEIEISEEW